MESGQCRHISAYKQTDQADIEVMHSLHEIAKPLCGLIINSDTFSSANAYHC